MADEAATTEYPIHPVTGVRALGIGKRGPIWPVIGGNGEGGDPPTDPNPPADPPSDPPADPPKAPEQEKPEADDTDWKAKYEETLSHSRKHEDQKKENKQKLDAVLAALGIEDKDKVDPKTLAADLATERTAKTSLAVENAVLRLAGKNGADADILVDSRSFMGEVTKLDPSADDFQSKVAAAIKNHLKEHPAAKLQAAPPDSSGRETGGDKNRNTETDPRKLAAMFPTSRY
ncbi:hypothetical protein [Gordonia terrae]